jgi:uncharacterized protein (TIGR02611 family)
MRILQRVSKVVLVTALGALLVAAGIVMLVTPGPGLLAIAAGLAVLAREYRWARRLLDRAKARLPHRHRRQATDFAARWDDRDDNPARARDLDREVA